MSSSVSSLQFLTRDKMWLFITRFFRLFAYGSLSVVLVFYLTGLGLTQAQTGLSNYENHAAAQQRGNQKLRAERRSVGVQALACAG